MVIYAGTLHRHSILFVFTFAKLLYISDLHNTYLLVIFGSGMVNSQQKHSLQVEFERYFVLFGVSLPKASTLVHNHTQALCLVHASLFGIGLCQCLEEKL